VDARGYVALAGEGRFREALRRVREKLPFPGILGYVCDHPCELHCLRLDEDSALRIRDVKRFLAEWEPGEPEHLIDKRPARAERVAVVGAGPAGLLAAHDLSLLGYPVTLFERASALGGCLSEKIPEWRLPARVVARDLSIIEALGIETRTGVEVGRELRLAELRADFDAVLLLVGYRGAQRLLERGGDGLERTRRDTILADPLTCRTARPGVFAGGEATSGPITVIQALALGRRAAESARRYLEGEELEEGREGLLPAPLLWTLEIDEEERRLRARPPHLLEPHGPGLSEEQVREEAKRCLDCECDLCVKECEFLAAHCRSPKDLARQVLDAPEEAGTLRMVYSCNVCALCSTVCPEELGTGTLLQEARREAVRRGVGPLREHRGVRSYHELGTSRSFGLARAAPGRRRSRRLFFPGCALPALSPRNTVAAYELLREIDPTTGVLLFCCGAPSGMLGQEKDLARTLGEIEGMAKGLGAGELIAACPDCAHTLGEGLPEMRVTTLWERLAEEWEPPRSAEEVVVAVHDACKTRERSPLHEAVRHLLEGAGARVEESEHSAGLTRCCGLGGMVDSLDPGLAARVAERSAGESARPLVTYCAGCRWALFDAGKPSLHLLDLLLGSDWRRAAASGNPSLPRRYLNRLRAKWALRRLRPVEARRG
jgi:NADPH-dependent glutamate synthase beta subunit-like oxidoreductase